MLIIILVCTIIIVTALLLKKKGYTDQTNSNKSGQEQIDREMKEHITQIRISMETETSLGNRLRTIIDLIGSFGVNKMNHINSILSLLTTVHLPKEYVLSSFKYGDEGFGYEHIPYIHRFDATTEWCPPENVNDKSYIRGHRIPNDNYATGAYKDEYLITGIWGGYERIIDQVPSILPYFELTFSEVGILDAWVLYNLRDLLPKYWHANYGAKDFIYGIEKIEKLFPENYNGNSCFAGERNTVKDQVRSLDLDELIPQVKIDGDIATFTCAYLNHFSGLYKMETTFERVGNRVQILSQNEKCLVLHRSNIMF